ncbi:major facilitator superfamily domain-containing protein [Mucor lusitanicus]
MANLSVPDPEDDKKLQLTDLGDRSHDNTLEDVAVSLESTPDQQQQQHDSSWSPFSKKHHHHHDEDDRFTSASTVYHHQIKRFGAIKKFWSRAMGDIYADDNPREYSRLKKNIIITIVAFSGISGPLGSMIYMPGLTQIQASLHTSTAAVNGSVSAYVVFMGIAPLFWASMSDAYGRKPMYVYSLIISVIASILCAISRNAAMLIVFRAIQAIGSSSGQTLGAGVIADTIDVADRGKAYGVFYIGPLLGPVIGPTVGGALCQYLGWQSTFYFLAIIGFVLLSMVFVFLPETVRRTKVEMLTNDNESGQEIVHKAEKFRALQNLKTAFAPMVAMLGDPTILVITFYNTTPTITETFQRLYGYTSTVVGLCYLVFGFGLMCGSVSSGRYADYVVRKLREKNGPENVYPELRLRAAFPSFVLIPTGYLIYAWTTEKGVGVYAPLIGLFVYALGQMNAFTPTSVYLVDSKPGRSASAVGINNAVRSVLAAVATIFSSQCVEAAGTGILFTILAAINVVNCLTLVAVMIWGKKWREDFEDRTGTRPVVAKAKDASTEKDTGSIHSSATNVGNPKDEYNTELAIVHSRVSQA